MNPWNALLESFHSALIDELNERLPDLKPELSLPRRTPGFSLSELRISEAWGVPVEMSSAQPTRGKFFLGMSQKAGARLKLSVDALAASVLKRAQKNEFSRRGISPQFESGVLQKEAAPKEVSLIIWMPMAIEGEPIHLGIGISK